MRAAHGNNTVAGWGVVEQEIRAGIEAGTSYHRPRARCALAMILRTFLVIALGGLLVAGCANTPQPDSDPSAPTDLRTADQLEELLEDPSDGPDPANIVSGVGHIIYVDLEGGFYGLEAEDGTQYNPLNLEEAFQEDGLRVRFRGVLRPDMMTTRMWGQNLEIEDMLAITVDED